MEWGSGVRGQGPWRSEYIVQNTERMHTTEDPHITHKHTLPTSELISASTATPLASTRRNPTSMAKCLYID